MADCKLRTGNWYVQLIKSGLNAFEIRNENLRALGLFDKNQVDGIDTCHFTSQMNISFILFK